MASYSESLRIDASSLWISAAMSRCRSSAVTLGGVGSAKASIRTTQDSRLRTVPLPSHNARRIRASRASAFPRVLGFVTTSLRHGRSLRATGEVRPQICKAPVRGAVSFWSPEHAIADAAAGRCRSSGHDDARLWDDRHERHDDDRDRRAGEVVVPDCLYLGDEADVVVAPGEYEDVGQDEDWRDARRDYGVAHAKGHSVPAFRHF